MQIFPEEVPICHQNKSLVQIHYSAIVPVVVWILVIINRLITTIHSIWPHHIGIIVKQIAMKDQVTNRLTKISAAITTTVIILSGQIIHIVMTVQAGTTIRQVSPPQMFILEPTRVSAVQYLARVPGSTPVVDSVNSLWQWNNLLLTRYQILVTLWRPCNFVHLCLSCSPHSIYPSISKRCIHRNNSTLSRPFLLLPQEMWMPGWFRRWWIYRKINNRNSEDKTILPKEMSYAWKQLTKEGCVVSQLA